MTVLNTRWLGRVSYKEAWDLQQRLFEGTQDHLLLLEHDPVYTLGLRGKESNFLVPPEELDAQVFKVNRGGDITFHGPGQLVGYPIMNVAGKRGGGMADTVAYVHNVEQLIINTLAELGLESERVTGCPGVWIGSRKIAAVGVRLSRGRSMHGFALNVDVDLDWFNKIVPCGILDKSVTSLKAKV